MHTERHNLWIIYWVSGILINITRWCATMFRTNYAAFGANRFSFYRRDEKHKYIKSNYVHCMRIVNGVVSIRDKFTRKKNIIKTLLLCWSMFVRLAHGRWCRQWDQNECSTRTNEMLNIPKTRHFVKHFILRACHMFEFFPFSAHTHTESRIVLPAFPPVCCSIFPLGYSFISYLLRWSSPHCIWRVEKIDMKGKWSEKRKSVVFAMYKV